jgi:acylphosphatase
MQDKICIHCFVSGKVQGVWYRKSTQDEAIKLGLTGWAKNLADGRVEVLISGEKDKVNQLVAWLKVGPPLANVTDVTSEEVEWQEQDRFGVK